MSIRCFDVQIENAHENRVLETQHMSMVFDYECFQHTYMAVGLACQDWARPSGANCCLGLDLDEPGCRQCRQQLEVEQWALALERWTWLRSERPDAQVDEEGPWSSLNTPLNRKWKNFKSLNQLLRSTILRLLYLRIYYLHSKTVWDPSLALLNHGGWCWSWGEFGDCRRFGGLSCRRNWAGRFVHQQHRSVITFRRWLEHPKKLKTGQHKKDETSIHHLSWSIIIFPARFFVFIFSEELVTVLRTCWPSYGLVWVLVGVLETPRSPEWAGGWPCVVAERHLPGTGTSGALSQLGQTWKGRSAEDTKYTLQLGSSPQCKKNIGDIFWLNF